MEVFMWVLTHVAVQPKEQAAQLSCKLMPFPSLPLPNLLFLPCTHINSRDDVSNFVSEELV